jgi:hypothetical protein
MPPRLEFIDCDVTVLRLVESLWCRTCALPSGVAALIAFSPETDPTWILWRGWVARCRDCHGDEIDEEGYR